MAKKDKKIPPHLPPKPTEIYFNNKIHFLLWIFLILILSSLTGLAVSLSTIAWIAPPIVQNQTYFLGSNNRGVEEIDPVIVQQLNQRVVSIYDTRRKIGGSFYSSTAFLGSAIMVSSDGWGAVYMPNYIKGVEKYWDVFDYQGTAYKVKNTIFDADEEVLYLKLEGEGFRVASFVDLDKISGFDNILILNKEGIKVAQLGEKEEVSDGSFNIADPQYRFLAKNNQTQGSLLFDTKGGYLGTQGQTGLIEGWQIEREVSSLLSEVKLKTNYLDVEGYFVEGYFEDNKWKKASGFYIVKLRSALQTEPRLAIGDVILKIGDQSVDKFGLAKQVLLAKNGEKITILRRGEQMEVYILE